MISNYNQNQNPRHNTHMIIRVVYVMPGASGIAKVGHMPHQKYFFVKFGNSNHDIIQANSNYILSSNIPKSSIAPINLVSTGNMLDHKFQQCILIVWNIPSNCGLWCVCMPRGYK